MKSAYDYTDKELLLMIAENTKEISYNLKHILDAIKEAKEEDKKANDSVLADGNCLYRG